MARTPRDKFCDVYREYVMGFDKYVFQLQICCWRIINTTQIILLTNTTDIKAKGKAHPRTSHEDIDLLFL